MEIDVIDRETGEIVTMEEDKVDPKKYETDLRWYTLRRNRDKLLADTDYLVTPDYPISAEKLAKVKAYRQKLRDVPSLEGAPFDGGKLPSDPSSITPWPKKDW